MATYRISQLADRVGVPATALRFYEKQGLLTADRGPTGYRLYSEADAERVPFITAAKQLGLSLEQVRDLLDVWDGGLCHEIRDELRPMIREQIADADQRLAELKLFREQLTAALDQLGRLPPKDAPCDTACECLHVRRSGRLVARGPASRSGSHPLPEAPAHTEKPIACSLDSAGHQKRVADWQRLLAGAERARLPDEGMRVRLPANRAADLAGLAVAEQGCCPFFTFRLILAGTHVELEAHAPDSTEPLVAALFAETDAVEVPC